MRDVPEELTGLVAAVERAFVVTGASTPGWPPPHPDRSPLDEEYSRVSDTGKYAIVVARARAWAQTLSEAGIATVHDVPAGSWIGWSGREAVHPAAQRLDPVHRGGLSLLVAPSLLAEVPAGLDLAITVEGLPTVLLANVPDCGCDACDFGSQDLVEYLDDWFMTVIRGDIVHARAGERHATRHLSGWSATSGAETWLDEGRRAPRGVTRWAGTPWIQGARGPGVVARPRRS